jgi:hypothetical protein
MEGRALVCCARTHMRLQESTSAVQELHAALRYANVNRSLLLLAPRRIGLFLGLF